MNTVDEGSFDSRPLITFVEQLEAGSKLGFGIGLEELVSEEP